jgi:peroxiredoxin family protein
MENRAHLIYSKNLKKRIFTAFKGLTIFEKNNLYEQRLRERTDQALKNYELNMKRQLDDLMELVLKAEEKLKHENRKKVQTKLQLDQIVLRGISALNLQALGLSQNTLTGKVLLNP